MPKQVSSQSRQSIVMTLRAEIFNRYISTLDVARYRQPLTKCGQEAAIERYRAEEPDHRHRWLLRARGERPGDGRPAEKRDEVASCHSITSSAVASRVGGTARPSILAVEALMTNSNLVDCTTGKSAGFAPLRMRPA